MKRAPRRVRAPAAETTEPRRRYLVPRHSWPTAWDQLTESRAAFVTGLAQPTPELDRAAPIEVFVAERGAAILERLGGRLVGAGGDPWQARMREFERLQREARAARARHDAAEADAFEAAFQREALRIREANGTPESEATP